MARERFQLHLNYTQGSKRVVRYRALLPTERDACLRVAATLAGATGTTMDLRLNEAREGIKRMLVEVSPPCETEDDVAKASFKALDAATLEMPGPMSYDELFTGKDDTVLNAIYRRLHEATAAEVEAIMGKALPVSAD